AFDGIERKIAHRLNTHVVGFTGTSEREKVDSDNYLKYIAPQDLKSFGLIPEIIGRLPVLVHLDPLDRDALLKVLTEPKNAIIKQYEKLFEMDGVKLTFAPETLEFIVDKAIEYKLGARGLRTIVETIMIDPMFETPSDKVDHLVITRQMAEEKLNKAYLGS
ncbi:MAG: ATP-dependent Clp protease ATP-binding subunit ClpX, partial [Duncaniella sp.]|nr:ATP-dependent Clp protease ATP-binding subunit ClpX [Duncaniella sp.]